MNTENLIPISYVKQFTPLVVGDELFIITSRREFKIECLNQLAVFNTNKNGSDCYDPSNYYLVSFADRPNTTGKQPVDDDVVVDVVYSLNKVHTVKAEIAGWLSEETDTHSATRNWKPNHAALLAKFKEQGANTMFTFENTKEATHIYSNTQFLKIKNGKYEFINSATNFEWEDGGTAEETHFGAMELSYPIGERKEDHTIDGILKKAQPRERTPMKSH